VLAIPDMEDVVMVSDELVNNEVNTVVEVVPLVPVTWDPDVVEVCVALPPPIALEAVTIDPL
jgi:hypothetical protein